MGEMSDREAAWDQLHTSRRHDPGQVERERDGLLRPKLPEVPCFSLIGLVVLAIAALVVSRRR